MKYSHKTKNRQGGAAINMPFGKHKGMPIEELPHAYLLWLRSRPDLWEPLRSAVDDEYRRRSGGYDYDYGQVPEFRFDREGKAVLCELVEVGRRNLAKLHHPDHGGSLVRMQLINRVADMVLEQLR